MGAPRGSSERTRQEVLAAARTLFATRGVAAVSVRDIAAAAGVNHALVHRYFGTKRDMVAALLSREADDVVRLLGPERAADPDDAATRLREALHHLLGEGRLTTLLVLRAELDGLAPERGMDKAVVPLNLLADTLSRFASDDHAADAGAVAAVVGAAVIGLAAASPLLLAGTRLDDGGQDAALDRCIEVLVALLTSTISTHR